MPDSPSCFFTLACSPPISTYFTYPAYLTYPTYPTYPHLPPPTPPCWQWGAAGRGESCHYDHAKSRLPGRGKLGLFLTPPVCYNRIKIKGMKEHIVGVTVANYVVMPNHIYMILMVDTLSVGTRYIVSDNRTASVSEPRTACMASLREKSKQTVLNVGGVKSVRNLPQRKRIRLQGYDYSSNGAYFVTICIAGRNAMLWNVGANCVRPNELPPLSDVGKIVDDEIQKLDTIYENVVVDKYCMMPDHIHAIVMVLSDENGRTQFAPTLSRIIKQFKGSITKQIGFSIWQKSFNDRITRNEKGYQEVWQYIDTNPLKWQEDCFYAN